MEASAKSVPDLYRSIFGEEMKEGEVEVKGEEEEEEEEVGAGNLALWPRKG